MNAFALAIEFALLVVLLAFSAFFSGSETALFSLSALQLQNLAENHGGRGRRVVSLMKKPTELLSTLLIGNTLVNVFATSLGYAIVGNIPSLAPHSASITVPVMTLLLLIFGEIAPKRAAIKTPEKTALLIAAPLAFFYRVFTPARAVLDLSIRRLRPLFRPERRSLSDEELLTAVEVGAEEGVLDQDERSMVDGIMQLSEMTASDVMTPRVDFEGIDLEDPPSSYLAAALRTTFRYLPVYRGTPDDFEGFLDVSAYMLDPGHDFRAAVRDPLFVPETAALDDLLITLQRGRRYIACVTDEYGGTAGLIARSDILEVFAGEFDQGGPDAEAPDIRPIGESCYLIDGDTSLEEINHDLDLDLEAEGIDRISGWVSAQAGRVLRVGESVEAQGCRVEVRRRRKQRINEVLLQILPSAGEEGAGDDAPDEDDADVDTFAEEDGSEEDEA